MTRPLTNQQQIVYDFIRDKIISRGYGPTVREIGKHMNIKSPNGVMSHLKALERKGKIVRDAHKSRAIELTETLSHLVGSNLPISGSIADGACVYRVDTGRSLDLESLGGTNRYVLNVHDESLLDAHIMPGDQLIIQKQSFAERGQLVLVRTSTTQTCLRYWIPESGRLRLQPVSRRLPPMIVENAEVVGGVVGVLRMYRIPPSLTGDEA